MKIQKRQGYCLLLNVDGADYLKAELIVVYYAKNADGVWEKVPFYQYEDNFPVGVHGDKSVMILQSFIKLTIF